MDTRTRTASPSADDSNVKQASPPPAQDKISAYYSLVFPNFTFYIQTLSITIGRRCAPNTASTSTTATDYPQVDVDLGALKSVSRLHAKIEYDQEEDRFVLAVIGRNGAWVDGVWSGAGARAPLGERSQIQIASRLFHFVLPPPPPPEDTPSPSSQSSVQRLRSPSVDITSISPPSSQPSHSPPPPELKLPPPSPEPQALPKQKPKAARPRPPPQPELPNSNSIGKSNKLNSKKRKKGDVEPTPIVERPKPEDMPPKPPFTYAQMIYRSIKEMGGKATLQEICNWISTKHEYYRYADAAWMSSVRHNLSSSRAFLKGERCGGERGKGFFWSVDDKFAQTLEEQELKAQQAAATVAQGLPINPEPKGRKKDKGTPLDPPLKRSVKGDNKGRPLPPPLTTSPLAFRSAVPPSGQSNVAPVPSTSGPFTTTQATTGVFSYPSHQSTIPSSGTNPYSSLAHSNWSAVPTPASVASSTSLPVQSPPLPAFTTPSAQTGVPDVIIPIILGPIPESHPDYTPGQPNNSAKEGYMVLHERKLILDPNVFGGLTREMLDELEKMGAPTALRLLTDHMIRALKEKRARERSKVTKKVKKKSAGAGATPSAPFTKVPLDEAKKMVTSATAGDNAISPVNSAPEPLHPNHTSGTVPSTSLPAAAPMDPGSPIIVVDGDSDDEGPAMKKRKIDGGMALPLPIPTSTSVA